MTVKYSNPGGQPVGGGCATGIHCSPPMTDFMNITYSTTTILVLITNFLIHLETVIQERSVRK